MNTVLKSYESPAVTVDVVIFAIENDRLKVLLIKRTAPPFKGSLALPGGFLLKQETAEKAIERILKEKAGTSGVYLEQLYTFDSLGRDPRGHIISITYFALAPREKIKISKSHRIPEPKFTDASRLPRLAFDHNQIIEYARRRLAAKLEYTNVVFSLLPAYFPLRDLQKTYEIILEKKFDKRNFRKKFMQLGLIQPSAKILSGKKQRPAKLYRFISIRHTELKKFFK